MYLLKNIVLLNIILKMYAVIQKSYFLNNIVLLLFQII